MPKVDFELSADLIDALKRLAESYYGDSEETSLAQIVDAAIRTYLLRLDLSSGPHHQDSGEAKIRESTAGVSRKPSSDCKACGCSSKHLCGLTAWNT